MTIRSLSMLGVVLVLGAASFGCSKKEEAQTVPVPSAAPAAPAGSAEGAAAASGATTTAAAAPTVTTRPQPTTTTTQPVPTRNESIDACCSALSSMKSSAKDAIAKRKAEAAAAVCPGIARLVKSGQTTRAAALTQIRSALVGTPPPSACQ